MEIILKIMILTNQREIEEAKEKYGEDFGMYKHKFEEKFEVRDFIVDPTQIEALDCNEDKTKMNIYMVSGSGFSVQYSEILWDYYVNLFQVETKVKKTRSKKGE